MTSNNPSMNNTGAGILFERVVSIIEEGRKNTVRAINFNIVLSYCLIGREIVEDIQEGKVRAEYGKQILEELSQKLNLQYGKGFSVANLRLFRQFYLIYSERMINYLRSNTYIEEQKSSSDDLATQQIIDIIRYPMGSELNTGFNPQLSWSHYRALIRVKKEDARLFYEQEAAECSWDKRTFDQVRTNVVRSIDNQMAITYRLIGCEIVEAAPWHHLLKDERINDYNLSLTEKQAIQKAKENNYA